MEVFCLNCAGTATGFSASDYSDVNDPVNAKLAALRQVHWVITEASELAELH